MVNAAAGNGLLTVTADGVVLAVQRLTNSSFRGGTWLTGGSVSAGGCAVVVSVTGGTPNDQITGNCVGNSDPNSDNLAGGCPLYRHSKEPEREETPERSPLQRAAFPL